MNNGFVYYVRCFDGTYVYFYENFELVHTDILDDPKYNIISWWFVP